MRQLQGVLWTKGVLLNPQHLQVQDRYLEDKLGFHLSALAYQPWGLLSVEMQDEALKAGEVILTRAAGLFADGLVFDIPAADAPPAPRSLEGHWIQDQPSLTIYLAIPEQRTGGRNVSSGDRGTRYAPSILSTTDENTGKSEKDILVASKNFRLLIEREAQEGSSVLPVARVLRAESGEVGYDPHFVPPIVDIAANDHVLSLARRLVEGLAARSAELSAMRRARNRGLAEFGRSDTAHFWLLYTVNSFLPMFRHVFEGEGSYDGAEPRLRRAHPVQLYRAMTELAGSLMTFSNRHPKDLPPYDHGRLSECFGELGQTLAELLETAIPSNCVTLPLVATERSTYAVTIDDDRHLAAIQAYLAVTTDLDQARLIEKAPAWIKVASRDQIGDLLAQAVAGIELQHTPAPPSALQVKGGSQYFRLEMVGPRWSSVLRSRSLAAWVSDDIPDPQLELVLLLPPDD